MKIPHRNRILIPLAATSLLILAACGNKGPLVMPQKPVPVEEQVVDPAQAPTEGQDSQTPPASQDTDAGSATTTPDPVTPQVDDGNDE